MTISIDGTPIPVTKFPDNTSQVWKLPDYILEKSWANVVWEFEDEAEVMHLAQLKDLLDAYDIQAYLHITYLPYARQDKTVQNDLTFALGTFAKILNSMNFFEVVIVDPHSHVAINKIKHSDAYYPITEVQKAWKDTEADLVCYPDKGATEKYTGIYLDLPYCRAEKIRDQQSGKIMGMTLHGNGVEGKRILIVDDICDGGRTFIGLAEMLLAAGATEVNLFVTHGIFSAGLDPLRRAGISRIFTKEGEV